MLSSPVSVYALLPSARKAITLIAIRTSVASWPRWTAVERIVRTLVVWRAHSGQRIPTGEVVMQSGQIDRPQFEQATAVSRPGWR